ncbi:PREDICTED: pentatricopeptide repeat-containing protein At5g27460-like [Camelina sativa]|uniref:Pentatricopeptide repeat-containing protein At5g27460-like n=1 Tax=Camelina sativa TaxID=90675 RepID=A0ABM0T6I8_CAMSA|nr:PREDICTED: pentatricopeptide repeat-containing protein At5g27460-like [Camelina sativa]
MNQTRLAAPMLIRFVAKTIFPSAGVAAARLVSSIADGFDTVVVPHRNGLKEILRKTGPRRSVPSLLQERIDSGHAVSLSELRLISKRLIRSNRHDLALQMMEWMEENQKDVQLSAYDIALKLELIIRAHGLKQAEEYFEQLLDTCVSSRVAKSAYLPLLRAYVKRKMVKEAEALMEKLNRLGFLVTPHPFNEMMKLYEASYQFEKVVMVVSMMKGNKIPRNVLSYNLWMNACCEVDGVTGVETVYREMVGDKSVEVGWSSLCTLANVYIKCGFDDKAKLVLESAEKMLNRSNRLGYFFLITLYSSLGNKEGVVRLWEASKSICGKISCANYICVLSSLVKIGDLEEAERVFSEWEAQCFNYDVRVSNVLLGAYVRKGDIRKAESLHNRVLERGGNPNYKTWEILMEGWVKCQHMEKAIDAMHRAFELMKGCHWRPSQNIVLAIAEYFEKEEKIEEATAYVRDLHRLGLASLPLYRLLLRMHEHAQRPAFDIYEMMKLDKIRIDL